MFLDFIRLFLQESYYYLHSLINKEDYFSYLIIKIKFGSFKN